MIRRVVGVALLLLAGAQRWKPPLIVVRHRGVNRRALARCAVPVCNFYQGVEKAACPGSRSFPITAIPIALFALNSVISRNTAIAHAHVHAHSLKHPVTAHLRPRFRCWTVRSISANRGCHCMHAASCGVVWRSRPKRSADLPLWSTLATLVAVRIRETLRSFPSRCALPPIYLPLKRRILGSLLHEHEHEGDRRHHRHRGCAVS